MSSFYDRWFRVARFCAEQRVAPTLACEMQRQRLQQARAYYAWVSSRRGMRRALPYPDPLQYPVGTPLLSVCWLYGGALEEQIGALPRSSLYEWAEAALEKLQRMSPDELYGSERSAGLGDWTPWALFTRMVVDTLHSFAHFVARRTPYSDNPYRFGGHKIAGWVNADKWEQEHGLKDA